MMLGQHRWTVRVHEPSPEIREMATGIYIKNKPWRCSNNSDLTVEAALPAWEAAVRFVSDRTQRWSIRYDFFTRQWPTALGLLRPPIIWASLDSDPQPRMRIAD